MNILTRSAGVIACAAIAIFTQSCDFGGFGVGGGTSLVPPAGTWVATEPTQCLSNPWEQEWLARHGNDYASYPRDADSQNAVIVAYYAQAGVDVQAVLSIARYEVVCMACSCPRGDTLYLLVPEQQAHVMIEVGYRKEEPRPVN